MRFIGYTTDAKYMMFVKSDHTVTYRRVVEGRAVDIPPKNIFNEILNKYHNKSVTSDHIHIAF